MKQIELAPAVCYRFHCIGGECTRSCCRDWAIDIRKVDYKKLQKLYLSSELATIRKEYVRILPDKSEIAYARLELDEKRNCAFWDKDGLCSLQKEKGAGALPIVCQRYPRMVNFLLGRKEYAVQMSCEAMVRLLIEEKDPLLFETRQAEPSNSLGVYDFELGERKYTPLLPYYPQLKALGIGILQNRYYTFEQRMLYLGAVLQSFVNLEEAGRVDEAADMLELEMNRPDSEDIRKKLDALPKDSSQAYAWTIPMLDLNNKNASQGWRELVECVYEKWQIHRNETGGILCHVQSYQEGRERYRRFCAERPHIMENIAVMLFHQMALPFGGVYSGNSLETKRDIGDNYQWFCFQIGIVQFVLAALLTDGIEDSELAGIVATCFRRFPINRKSAQDMVSVMMPKGIPLLDRVSIFLKG